MALEGYLLDWLSLLARWAHLAAGIAWIGSSFYLAWLEERGEPARDPQLSGEPWFKWAAYWTWITGFMLLVIVHYLGAGAAAVGIGLGSLVAGLAAYEALCRSPLGKNDTALGAALFVLLAAIAWALCQVFGGRGAFIHYGAILGTIMAGNIGHVIVPGQRRMAEALRAGREPDPRDGLSIRQRNLHNSYFTLPVLFTMISSHHAASFAHRWNWLVLVALTLAGVLIRVWFVLRHKGSAPAWILAAGIAFILGAIFLVAPGLEPIPGQSTSPK